MPLTVRPLVVALLTLSACSSPSTCALEGSQQCDSDGHSVLRCVATDRGLRWQTEPCDPSTPTCVERRGGAATCIAERLGSCEEATFEDSCPDESTLEDCTAGARHRVRCLEGERCGEVPAAAVGEDRPPHATHACYAPRSAEEPPALVTFVSGDVQLGDRAAPPVPFRVPHGTRLRLAAGARAVVLVKERASRLTEPGEVDVYTLQPEAAVAAPWAAALVEILGHEPPRAVSPEEPLLAPAPSEAGLVRLAVGEGTPGASSTLGDIVWRCEGAVGCGRTVELRASGTNARVLWRGSGEGRVHYDGPELERGETYELRLGEHAYRVETLPPPPVRDLLVTMQDLSLPEQMSVVAAIHRWAGSRAAAVATLRRTLVELHGRDRDTQALLEAYGVPR